MQQQIVDHVIGEKNVGPLVLAAFFEWPVRSCPPDVFAFQCFAGYPLVG